MGKADWERIEVGAIKIDKDVRELKEQGLSNADIAKKLGLPESSVRASLKRPRSQRKTKEE